MKTDKNVAVYDSKMDWLHNRSTNARARPVGINWNVTGRRHTERAPRQVPEYDTPTGLASAERFEREVTASFFQAQAGGGTTAVMAIDLDQTKYLEGKTIDGDELLKSLAARLSGSLRRGDSIGRLADGRFVVGLANLGSGEDARIVAQKIVWGFSEPIHLAGEEIHTCVRIGIALPGERFDPAAMIKRATIAMRNVEARCGGTGYEFHRQFRGVSGGVPARGASAPPEDSR